MACIYIAAAHKSSGKTTVSIGLCAALRSRGHTVQPFKKGPDYIDPIWLSQAAGRDCYNLDFNTMDSAQLCDTVATHAADADIAIIEGNKGLFDGIDVQGADSNAALAALLQAPVLLVIDTRGMTRGVAPLVSGYRAFDMSINIAGVILNQVGGPRHEAKLRAALKEYTDVPVVGVLHKEAQLIIEERHLGLVPGSEAEHAARTIERIRAAISDGVDLQQVIAIAGQTPALPPPQAYSDVRRQADVRIGIPRDAAFGFYYSDDLDELRRAGAELVFVDSLRDRALPEVDGLFIGGGFPETQMRGLAANESLRRDVLRFVEADGPVYAECGGLMYLGRRLSWRGRQYEMVGALPLNVVMQDRPVGRGYVELTETGRSPWGSIVSNGVNVIRAHEFHYSRIENLDAPRVFAYRVQRGFGIDGEFDGLIHRNVVANYAHLRNMYPVCWAQRFVEFVRRCAGSTQTQVE
jgi:cobyrinic acid a,c-diamide synthase